MENKQQSGTCAYCMEESGRLFTPPLITPPDWSKVTEREINRDGVWAWWRAPVEDRSYSGKELFEIITLDGVEYLRPYESPNEPICWECFCGQLWPALRLYTVNWPPQIKQDGWLHPEWFENELVKYSTPEWVRRDIAAVNRIVGTDYGRGDSTYTQDFDEFSDADPGL